MESAILVCAGDPRVLSAFHDAAAGAAAKADAYHQLGFAGEW
jgi:hypothetical protein